MKRRNNSFLRSWRVAFACPKTCRLVIVVPLSGGRVNIYEGEWMGAVYSAQTLAAGALAQVQLIEKEQGIGLAAADRLRVLVLASDADMPREFWGNPESLIFSERSAEFVVDSWRVHVKGASGWGWQGEALDDFVRGYLATDRAINQIGGFGLLASPALTGAYLAESLLPCSEVETPPADFLAELSRSTQNRVEYFFPFVSRSLYEYDQRFAYAAHAARELPGNLAYRVKANHFIPYEPGFYVARVTVPQGWNHVGLLPFYSEGQPATWPTSGEFVTFAAEPEIRLALAHGWDVQIQHGWRFEKARPLENWKRKLCAARQLQLERGQSQIDGMISARQLKAILHQAIGKFYARGYTRERVVSESQFLDLDVLDFVREGKKLRIQERVENDGRHYMPHVAAYIWALSRTATLAKALTIPKPLLAGFNADAVYSAVETAWGDTGSPGQFVLKSSRVLPRNCQGAVLNSISDVRNFLKGGEYA